MKNGKYCSGKKSLNMKPMAVLLALTLLVGCAVGGTLAWLTAKSNDVTNTFTPSDINISLTEETGDTYKMVPGTVINKDPVVKVLANSEASWLFVKVVEVNDVDTFLEYSVITDDGEWTAVEGYAGYYYREVDAVPAGTADAVLPSFPVIYYDVNKNNECDDGEENKVHVKDTVTKEAMNALTTDTYPKLVFTAAAVQKENIETVADAWSNLPAAFKA